MDLGTWKVNHFTGKGAATDWRDASLVLSNCLCFHGYDASHIKGYGTAISYNSSSTLNRWRLTLYPQNGTVDTVNGIMSIDRAVQHAASGVGI